MQISDGTQILEATLPESGEVTPEEKSDLDNLLDKVSNNKTGEQSSPEDAMSPLGAMETSSPVLNEEATQKEVFSDEIVDPLVLNAKDKVPTEPVVPQSGEVPPETNVPQSSASLSNTIVAEADTGVNTEAVLS